MADSTDAAQTASTGAVTAFTDAIKQWTSVMPDLSKVPAASLTTATTPPLFADLADYEALHHIAVRLAGELAEPLKDFGEVRLLVTSDTTLAVSEGLARGVRQQLRDLLAQAGTLNADPPLAAKGEQPVVPTFAPADAMGAAVAALPDILTLLSAQRTISTSSSASGDDLAVASAVIGQLGKAHRDWRMDYDTIRLLPTNGQLLHDLQTLDEAQAKLTDKANALPDGTKKTQITTLLGGIIAFQTAINLVPTGSSSSPLTTALLREQLDSRMPKEGAPRFTHVLVVSTRNTSASGGTQHHLVGNEKFTTIGAITVAYFLLHVEDRQLISAGTLTQTATARGDIGSSLTVELVGHDPVDTHSEDRAATISEVSADSREPERPRSRWQRVREFIRGGASDRAVTADREGGRRVSGVAPQLGDTSRAGSV